MSVLALKEKFPAIAFGTSGVRALVTDLTEAAVAAYVWAFVQRMQQVGFMAAATPVQVGMDLRPSSPAIALAVCNAVARCGYPVSFLGALPTPALALQCLAQKAPGIMVTGSHIPFDRNGIKFYSPIGEILKDDEQAISAMMVPGDVTAAPGACHALPVVQEQAARAYEQRYVQYFGTQALQGLRVGVYQHSAVGRDITVRVLESLGATVLPLGRSDTFVPVDTEAVSQHDVDQATQWCAQHTLDAVVSTDGDGDRPLVFNQHGQFIPGDCLGLVCARSLGISHLAVPVSCTTALEMCGSFSHIQRTRIGSPFVIQAMNSLLAQGVQTVAGFEANGGFLLATAVNGLAALPTRDALLPMVAVLAAAKVGGKGLSALIEQLPVRFTHSNRLKNVPSETSRALLLRVQTDDAFRQCLFPGKGPARAIDITDGVRLTFNDGEIAHLRASGNAPELRCYAEAGTPQAAQALCNTTLGRLA